MMNYLKQFLLFWYDFIIGDDWRIAAGVVIGLVVTKIFVTAGVNAWWLMPAVVVLVVGFSLWRETRKVE
jgi:hypothetical protein